MNKRWKNAARNFFQMYYFEFFGEVLTIYFA